MNHNHSYIIATGGNNDSAELKLLIEQQQAILSQFQIKLKRSQEKDTNNDGNDNNDVKEVICPTNQKADDMDTSLQLQLQVAPPSIRTERDVERDIIAKQQAILDDINAKNRARSSSTREDLDVKIHAQPKTATWATQSVFTNDDKNTYHDEREQEHEQLRSDVVASCYEYDCSSCISGKNLGYEEMRLVQKKFPQLHDHQLEKQTHADHDKKSPSHVVWKCKYQLRYTDLIYEEEDSKPPAREHCLR